MARWRDYTEVRGDAAHSVVGTVKILEGVASPDLGGARDLLVYLPPSYATSYRNFPVIYMHDGQNLFDGATSFAGEWQVDESMERLCDEGIEAIVVGIPNAGLRRLDEYSPFADERFGGGQADAYLRFVVHTVRPAVESAFRVTADRDLTGIAGSSMGGLVSLYAFFQYPHVFGFCGALSPSVGFARAALVEYLHGKERVPGRIWLDVGTREGSPRARDPLSLRVLETEYVKLVRRVHALLADKGWRDGEDLALVVEEGGLHNEQAWARRFPDMVRFLLGTRR